MGAETVMTEPELQALCARWQARLRLQDWDICVKILRERDMPEKDSAATCTWHLQKKRAILSFLDPIDHEPDDRWPHADHDMERSLVHELLHLHAAPFDTFKVDGAKDRALEQAVHAISLALIELDRRGKDPPEPGGEGSNGKSASGTMPEVFSHMPGPLTGDERRR